MKPNFLIVIIIVIFGFNCKVAQKDTSNTSEKITTSKNTEVQIIDTPTSITTTASCLVNNGITTVFRYYAPEGDRWKALTSEEAKAIINTGIQIGVVFEGSNGNELSAFNQTTGYNDGKSAFDYASQVIKQPFDSAIYFAVDLDITNAQLQTNIIPYFKGIQQALSESNTNYQIGVYGCGTVINALKNQGLCKYRWLSASTSFNGTQEALANQSYDLVQQVKKGFSMCGITPMDKDFIRTGATIGTFFSLDD